MHNKIKVNKGDVFGRLTIIEEVEKHVYPSGDTRRKFLAQCSCGSLPKSYLFNQLTSGNTKSCGCLDKEQKTTHGMHKTRAYQCWADMKTRCDCKENKFYESYGGRGITYCDKWKTFEGFWEDMKDSYADNLTLNRRDNDKGYYKENCEWDSISFQNHMRRKLKGTIFKYFGLAETESGRIAARIKIDLSEVHLGSFKTELEAAKAYDDASEMIYGDRPNKTENVEDWILLKVRNKVENRNPSFRPKGSSVATAKLKEADVLEIVVLYQKGLKQKDIAEMFGVSSCTVSSICRGDSWVSVTGITKNP